MRRLVSDMIRGVFKTYGVVTTHGVATTHGVVKGTTPSRNIALLGVFIEVPRLHLCTYCVPTHLCTYSHSDTMTETKRHISLAATYFIQRHMHTHRQTRTNTHKNDKELQR